MFAGIAVLVARRRRADGRERAQLRWFVAGSGLVVATVALIAVVPEDPSTRFLEVLGLVVVVGGFWALPAAIVVAVLRYRLYDIDRLVRRSVTYTAVVGMLAAVYAGGVFVLSVLLPLHGDLVVAGATLTVAALFNPLRRRVQHGVDRRFNRPRYDAELELERFTARLRDEHVLDDLVTALADEARATVHPAAVSVCIRP